MSRSAVSPRVFQLYSPRRPSPLGLPPYSMGSQDIPTSSSAYPKTPERYYYQYYPEPTSHGMRFPPDVHRRTSTQRSRASPPAPLSLDAQHHPAAIVVHLPSIEETLQPHATEEMCVPSPSPIPSSTSSLSLYSNESAKKNLEIGEEGEEGERKKGGSGSGGGSFCLCFNFSALFGTKSKPNKILAPQSQAPQMSVAEPAPAPQMVQPRRRPPSLVLVR